MNMKNIKTLHKFIQKLGPLNTFFLSCQQFLVGRVQEVFAK